MTITTVTNIFFLYPQIIYLGVATFAPSTAFEAGMTTNMNKIIEEHCYGAIFK